MVKEREGMATEPLDGQQNGTEGPSLTDEDGGYANQLDAFLTHQGQGQKWELAKELLTGSEDMTKYLPRSRVKDDKEITRDLRIISRYYEILDDDINMPLMLAIKYHYRMGLHGLARQEAIQATQSENRLSRLKNNVFDRARGIDRSEINVPASSG